MATIYIRAPDHLGDGVMALPAIRAVASLGPSTIDGPPWAEELYGSRCTATPQADVAVLFKPSFSAAWRARRCGRRIGVRWDLRGPLLTEPVPRPEGHRCAEYAAIARSAGAEPTAQPSFTGTGAPPHDLPEDFVLLLPMTRSPRTAGWTGFTDLAQALGKRAVLAGGPGETAALQQLARGQRVLPELSIADFAATAQMAAAVVGNDSGLSHLAAAAIRGAGGDPSTVHVVYGATDPAHTGPPGSTAHRAAPLPCWPCYRKRCGVAQPSPCLDVPPETVLEALGAA